MKFSEKRIGKSVKNSGNSNGETFEIHLKYETCLKRFSGYSNIAILLKKP